MRQLVIGQSITPRDSLSLAKYLQDINKVSLISAEEEAVLAVRIRSGDHQALHELTLANLRFVVSVAKQYQSKEMSLCDLINEGNLGLIKAAKTFDETKGFKFISFAVWWIRQSILEAIGEQTGLLRVPLNQRSVFIKIQKAQAVLEQELERDASHEELATLLELSIPEVALALRCHTPLHSLDAQLSDNSSSTLNDTICSAEPGTDHRVMHHESLHHDLQHLMKQLSSMEVKILCSSYGIGGPRQNIDEIGRQFSLSGERIRQLRQRALCKLRKSPRSEALRSYLSHD